MEGTENPPKRPLTPYFLFMEEERSAGRKLGNTEGSEKWKALSDSERKKYFDEYNKAREKFQSYLDDVGFTQTSGKKSAAAHPSNYRGSRVRAVCGMYEDVKEMSSKQCRALGAVAVYFLTKRNRIGSVRPGLRRGAQQEIARVRPPSGEQGRGDRGAGDQRQVLLRHRYDLHLDRGQR